MREGQTTLSVQVDQEVKDSLQSIADSKGVFLSETVRGLLGWESVDIFPNTMKGKRDTDIIMNLALNELLPLNSIELIKEALEHANSDQKKTTLSWLLRRQEFLYQMQKLINDQFIDLIERADAEKMADVFDSFATFIKDVPKTKENLNNLKKACKVNNNRRTFGGK